MRTIHAKRIETPAARAKLKPNPKPYRGAKLDKNVIIACKRDGTGSDFVGLFYVGGGNYVQRKVGRADDNMPANGETVLSYFQACRKTLQMAAKILAPTSMTGPSTVATVMEAYLDCLERQGSKSIAEARRCYARYILPTLGQLPVDGGLTTEILSGWLVKLTEKPVGGKVGEDALSCT